MIILEFLILNVPNENVYENFSVVQDIELVMTLQMDQRHDVMVTLVHPRPISLVKFVFKCWLIPAHKIILKSSCIFSLLSLSHIYLCLIRNTPTGHGSMRICFWGSKNGSARSPLNSRV
jgi:hypothetical protein